MAVETSEQEETLFSLGYDWVQGYRYGMPLPAPPRSGDVPAAGDTLGS